MSEVDSALERSNVPQTLLWALAGGTFWWASAPGEAGHLLDLPPKEEVVKFMGMPLLVTLRAPVLGHCTDAEALQQLTQRYIDVKLAAPGDKDLKLPVHPGDVERLTRMGRGK